MKEEYRYHSSGVIGSLLGIAGGFGALIYFNIITHEYSDMTPTILGLLAGKVVGEGLEYLLFKDCLLSGEK
ncbi:MAG: hypothetical protein AABX04_03790 [Nanoarchaeota archaeon]